MAEDKRTDRRKVAAGEEHEVDGKVKGPIQGGDVVLKSQALWAEQA
jgi:hypothetical protein